MAKGLGAVAAGCALLALAPPALAATVAVNGVVDAADPDMAVVFIATPNCAGQGATPIAYDLVEFTVDQTGSYQFDLTSPGGGIHLYVHENSFDPAASFPTCIAGSNDDPVTLNVNLTAGTTYFAVPFDDTFAQAGDSWDLTIDGPGAITVVGATAVVPTLTEWAMILLAGLLGLTALAFARRRIARLA